METPPQQGMEVLADRFRLLAEPTRLRLLWLLADQERCVSDLAHELGCTQANVSKHLSMLSDAGILQRRKDGLHCYHMVSDPGVFELCEAAWESVRRTNQAKVEATAGGVATARS